MISIDTCEPFFEFMRKYVDLDREAMELIAGYTGEVTHPARQIIVQENSKCDKVHFVISGTARSYYTDFTGKTVTWSFHFNKKESVARNLFAVDYRAFLTGQPSSIAIETLSELKALTLTKQQITYLIEHCYIYERWQRKVNETAFLYMYDRAFTLLTMTATERYSKLLKEEPHLLQMFSNFYIASYLGIAPQSLSRIKNQR